MAKGQVQLGYIKDHPDFTKGAMMDDSILRKVIGVLTAK
jgi:hypothetical protein